MSPARESADIVRRRCEAAALERLAAALERGASWFLILQAALLIGLLISGRL